MVISEEMGKMDEIAIMEGMVIKESSHNGGSL